MRIYITDVTVPTIEFLSSGVSRERIERMEGFRFEIDKRRGLAAETLLNYGLKRLYGRLSFPVKLFRDEDGKPHLDLSDEDKALLRSEGILFSENIEFSLSHSGDYAVCAISEGKEGEIGTDIEKHKRAQKGIAEHFFCEGEKQRIKTDEDFYRYWTLKESFIKAVGKGLAISLDSFEVFEKDGIASYKQSINDKVYTGRVYHPYPGYSLSVCAEGRNVRLPEQDEIETVMFS